MNGFYFNFGSYRERQIKERIYFHLGVLTVEYFPVECLLLKHAKGIGRGDPKFEFQWEQFITMKLECIKKKTVEFLFWTLVILFYL